MRARGCSGCVSAVPVGLLMGFPAAGRTAALQPQRRNLAARKNLITRHTGTNGIREHCRQHSVSEGQRR